MKPMLLCSFRLSGLTLFFILMTAPCSLLPGQDEAGVFDLPACIAYAREHQLRLRNLPIAEAVLLREEARTRADFLPAVTGLANFRYNPILPVTVLPTDFPGSSGDAAEVRFGTRFNNTLALQVRQLIFDPAHRLQLERNALDRSLLSDEKRYEEQWLQTQVKSRYFLALLYQEIWQEHRTWLSALDTLLRNVAVQVDNQVEDPAVLNDLRYQYAREAARIPYDSLNYRLALEELKVEMGFPAGASLQLPADTARLPAPPSGFEVADNWEWQQISADLQRSRLQEEELERQRLPELTAGGYFGAQYFSDAANYFDFDRWSGIAYLELNLNVPIFDQGKRRQNIEIEQLRRRQLRNQQDDYRNRQELAYRRALLELELAGQQLRREQAGLDHLQQNLTLARMNFQNEITGYRPVYQALQALRQARDAWFNAKAGYIRALLDLELADL